MGFVAAPKKVAGVVNLKRVDMVQFAWQVQHFRFLAQDVGGLRRQFCGRGPVFVLDKSFLEIIFRASTAIFRGRRSMLKTREQKTKQIILEL